MREELDCKAVAKCCAPAFPIRLLRRYREVREELDCKAVAKCCAPSSPIRLLQRNNEVREELDCKAVAKSNQIKSVYWFNDQAINEYIQCRFL